MSAPADVSKMRELTDIYVALNADERTVLLTIARRLMVGRRQYGALDLTTDRRDMVRELFEEVVDASVYAACELARGAR